MSPGARGHALRDLALDHEHEALAVAGAWPSRRWRMGLVMWYGMLATTS